MKKLTILRNSKMRVAIASSSHATSRGDTKTKIQSVQTQKALDTSAANTLMTFLPDTTQLYEPSMTFHGIAARVLTIHQGEPDVIPGGVTEEFSHTENVVDAAVCHEVFTGSSPADGSGTDASDFIRFLLQLLLLKKNILFSGDGDIMRRLLKLTLAIALCCPLVPKLSISCGKNIEIINLANGILPDATLPNGELPNGDFPNSGSPNGVLPNGVLPKRHGAESEDPLNDIVTSTDEYNPVTSSSSSESDVYKGTQKTTSNKKRNKRKCRTQSGGTKEKLQNTKRRCSEERKDDNSKWKKNVRIMKCVHGEHYIGTFSVERPGRPLLLVPCEDALMGSSLAKCKDGISESDRQGKHTLIICFRIKMITVSDSTFWDIVASNPIIGDRRGQERELEMACQECNKDKLSANDNEHILAFTFDLQAVLNAPKGPCGQIFYLQKLEVHNLTVYNLANQNGVCICGMNLKKIQLKRTAGWPLTTQGVRKAYNMTFSISAPKYKDLCTMCEKLVIPREHHAYYCVLKSDEGVCDALPEPHNDESEEEFT
ncbi:hypothetical protein PR048_012255 [Dryococelus australis]|uniref:Uncharacterized protein n=1 Tax=Dryococelus australis TaxID=614101 RepID=A0ABQ9HNU0_9NEOP|nr:hypothetical protein PR048_012255 [Dryococelus australis]